MKSNRDPLDIDGRAYAQLGKCLDIMEAEEAIPFKERVAALSLILRLRDLQNRRDNNADGAGSAVRKYSSAFAKANAAGGRKARTGRTDPVPADDDEPGYDLDSDAA
jgi:hypothetical protein